MNYAKHQKNQSGQAILEWVVISMFLLALWFALYSIANTILHQTIADSWSIVAARRALSQNLESLPSPRNVQIIPKSFPNKGKARVTAHLSQTGEVWQQFSVRLPIAKEVPLPFITRFFGFPYLAFLD